MNTTDLKSIEGFEELLAAPEPGTIRTAYCSDLLSDVMGHAPADSVLVTVQAHKNTVAVANLAGVRALVLCNGRAFPDDALEAARRAELAVFATADSQFIASCRIYEALGRPLSDLAAAR
ncbi:iron-sulfur binding hydrogenase [Kiritimatiella glycovorans]|uniref:DRTGG domain protein n=1 Tax=Kiritimatiella glycovorans TaxID=1307763 RepID=A0A0G3EB04_9BACT|nr:iron-sulfur binding hydrogenase [Kiritimatiella glycovorans]AKJ63666.1 DRTGG domain protein [Kiritimatiella glycovorans]